MSTSESGNSTSKVRSDQLEAGMTLVIYDEDVETEWKILGVTRPEDESSDIIHVRFETDTGVERTLKTRAHYVQTVRLAKVTTGDGAVDESA